jgi:cytochrome c-type biogenesis protein CcmF
MAHMGVGIAILGMTGTSLLVTERIEAMRPGDTMALAGYELRYERLESGEVANYAVERGTFTLLQDGKAVGTLEPERRWYPVAQMPTTEAAIEPRWLSDVYVALGDPLPENGRVVRAYYHPMVHLLWAGLFVMAVGGALSLTDRRYRVGAPKPSAARKPAGYGSAGAAAE